MSALCCPAPSLNLMSTGSTGSSSLPMYHFSRPSNDYSFMPIEFSQYGSSRMQPDPFYGGPYQPVQQQFLVPQQQSASSATSRARRKRLEEAVTEAIPSASSGKVSQRIAQLQQSLYSSAPSSARVHPLTSSSNPSRPLSLDPTKDYSKPLTVDCSIEYDLPRVVRPPPGAKPLLLIARRPAPVQQQQTAVTSLCDSPSSKPRQVWNCNPASHHHHSVPTSTSQQFIRPDCGYFVMNVAPVISSSSSEDSGRGTDSERTSSPISHQPVMTIHHPASWTTSDPPPPQYLRHPQLKMNAKSSLPAVGHHPRPVSESGRGTRDQPCQCCPSRGSIAQQRWAPYNTTAVLARHACPAPMIQQQQPDWTRWNSDDRMAFHS